MEGTEIKHDFIIENHGRVPLIIKNLRPDRGCSVASNPGQIPAGGKDKISVVVNTKNRGGGLLQKRFSVFTNDPKTAHKVVGFDCDGGHV